MKHIATMLAVAAVTSLAGCAAPYKPPTSGAIATLVIEVPGENMFGITQFTSIVPDEKCTNPALLAAFSPIRTKSVSHVVQAESRIYLVADLGSSEMQGSSLKLRGCKQMLSFIPRQGAQYVFRQRFVGQSCYVDLVQAGDTQPPASLVTHSTKACG